MQTIPRRRRNSGPRRRRRSSRARRGVGKPETFNVLGFAFIRGRSPTGKFLIHRKSRRDRVQAKLREIKEALRRRMDQSVPEQGKRLGQVVRGFFNDRAAPTNSRALAACRRRVTDLRRRTLRRRSQMDHTIWARTTRLENDRLPKPAILHPCPSVRFAVKNPRWEPDARIGPVRIGARGARQCASLPRSGTPVHRQRARLETKRGRFWPSPVFA
ncbi:MAG: hypothetical protein ABR970_03010 [Roseiarcus sp.]